MNSICSAGPPPGLNRTRPRIVPVLLDRQCVALFQNRSKYFRKAANPDFPFFEVEIV
jgi:hypothetical protein